VKLYTAFDLHANNSYMAIVDQEGQKVAGKKLMVNSSSMSIKTGCCRGGGGIRAPAPASRVNRSYVPSQAPVTGDQP